MVSWKSTHMGQSQYIVTVSENAQKLNFGCTITEVLHKHHSNILKPFISSAAAAAKSLQSCPTLCNPIDGSPPGSAVPGILLARTLEWVAIAFSA